MKRPTNVPQNNLLHRIRKLQNGILGTLSNYESRSAEEINAALKAILKWAKREELVGDYVFLLGDMVVNSSLAIDWVDGKVNASEYGVNIHPPLEFTEFSLLIGLILAQVAQDHFESKAPRRYLLGAELAMLAVELQETWESLRGSDRCRNPRPEFKKAKATLQALEERIQTKRALSLAGRKAADAKHNIPGGSRDKKEQIRTLWASGNYSTRDICAEQECAALNMSFAAARRALRNTPSPS